MNYNKTKIVATMGPASSPPAVLEQMIRAGVDICRINFSHGNYDDVKSTIDTIRSLNKKLKTNVGILADLQGPKLRIGDVENNAVEKEDGTAAAVRRVLEVHRHAAVTGMRVAGPNASSCG